MKNIIIFSILIVLGTIKTFSQCTSQSAPNPIIGAMMNPQYVNLWKMALANDKYGQDYNNTGKLAIGDDGWPIAGRKHAIRYYPNDILPLLNNNDVLKIRYKGPASAVIGAFGDECSYQKIQANTPSNGYTTAELKLSNTFRSNQNGCYFEFIGGITDIQIIRPGYTFDDPRLLVDEYVQHAKHWKAFRFMGYSGVNGSYDMTWAKRLSKNAPLNVNIWQTSFIDLGNNAWAQDKSNGMNENSTLAQMGGGRQRGTSWEDQIDICNALNIDMWINLPVLVDDDYIKNLAALIKDRLKPSLNVNVEIGNEIWNRFGPTFMSGYLMTQLLSWEFKWGTAEQKKIWGGSFCPGCNLSSNYDDGAHSVGAQPDNSINGGVPWDAWQRWQARRLKEHAESFATVFGWRESGGDVGNRIRMVLCGQIGYGSNGMAWNIGPGLEFLMAAYGPEAPHKYLYAVAVTGYTTPGTGVNSTVNQIVAGEKANIESQYAEYSDEPWNAYFMGNKLEGVFGKARMFGLKMYAYEGGNEISTGGLDGKWEDYTNGDAYFSDPRSGNNTTLNLTNWYSWFGYDALFIKNGDYQQNPLSGYSISRTLNEATPIRMAYINMANGAAPAMSTARGGVIGDIAVRELDARKIAAYWSNWNTENDKTIQVGTNNWQLDMGNTNTFDSPMLIRCQKNGTYKIEILVNENCWNKKADIYLNEKIIAADYVLTGSNSLPVYESAGGTSYRWSTASITVDIPYGVHALRVVPKTPVIAGTVPATQFAAGAGDNGYACWPNCNGLAMNRISIRKYRFTLSSALPPFQPKEVIGDLTVCKGNNKASYEVGENDPSACEYEWTDLPAGAKILDKVQIVGSNPATYSSGQGIYKIYIDWANVAVGTYTLKVLAKNLAADNITWQSSPERTFTVKVEACGFTIAPSPVCITQPATFTPEPMTNIAQYIWDNGMVGAPNNVRYTTLTSSQSLTATYTSAGVYSVSLKTIANDGKEKFYYNTVNAIACNSPAVTSPINLCVGQVATPLTAIGTSLRWYTVASGGTGSSTAPTPSTAVAGTTSYWVSQNSGIESDRARIDVVISESAVAGTISGAKDFCESGTVPTLQLNGSVGTIQWQQSTNATTGFTNIVGESNVTYTPTSFTGTKYFRASLTACGSPVSTASVKISAIPKPNGGTVNAFVNIVDKGKSPEDITLTGNDGTVVKWQYSEPPFLTNSWKDTIVKSTTLTSPALYVPTRFRAVVNNGYCADEVSSFVEINVVPYDGGNLTGGKEICYGESGVVLTLENYNGVIEKWQYSNDPLKARTDILSNAGSVIYTAPALYQTTWYWAIVNGKESTPDSIVVFEKPYAGTISAVSTTVAKNTMVDIQSQTSVIVGNIIGWESKAINGTYNQIAGSAGKTSINTGMLSQSMVFRMVVGNGVCGNVYSNELLINVFDASVGVLSSNEVEVCTGTAVTLSLNNSTGSVVNWSNAGSINGLWGNIFNTDSILTVTPSTTTYYKVRVKMPDNSIDSSNIVTVTVYEKPIAGNLIVDAPNVCSGNDAGLIRLDGSVGNVSKWEISLDNANYFTIDNQGLTYPAGVLTESTYYKVTVTNGVCSEVVTAPLKISVLPGPKSDLMVEGSSICKGGVATVSIKNKQAGVKYSLQDLSGTAIVSTVDSVGSDVVFSIANVSTASNYRIQAGSLGCSALLQDEANVTIVEIMPVEILGPIALCPSDTAITYSVTEEANHIYLFEVAGGNTISSTKNSIIVNWNANQGSITVIDSLMNSCASKNTITIQLTDTIAPKVNCLSQLTLSVPIDSIVKNNYSYLQNNNELEAIGISDNCGIQSIINNYNNADSILTTAIQFSITDAIEYTQSIVWTVTDRMGLISTCETKINLLIDAELIAFSAFSPNGDTKNDTWKIKNIEKYPTATVQVFNRWGQLVFECKENYSSHQWDGSNLPVDSYHYIISLNGKMMQRGVVSILK